MIGKTKIPAYQLLDEKAFSISNGLWTGKHPPFAEATVLRSVNFRDSGFFDFANAAVLQVGARQLESRKLHSGDIVVERSGGGKDRPVGRVCIFEGRNGVFSFSNFTSRIRVADSGLFVPEFVHLFLHHQHMVGATRRIQQKTTNLWNLDMTQYKKIAVPCPPLPMQREIVAHMIVLRESIENAIRNEAVLQELKKSVLWRIFNAKRSGKTYAISDLCTRIVQSIAPPLPADALYIGLEHIVSGAFIARHRGQAKKMLSTKLEFSAGDTLYGKLNPHLDKAVVVDANGICTTDILVLRPKPEIPSWYLVGALHSSDFVRHARATARGATLPRTSWDCIKDFRIWAHSEKEREAAARVFQALEEKLSARKAKTALLQELQKSALCDLIGRIKESKHG